MSLRGNVSLSPGAGIAAIMAGPAAKREPAMIWLGVLHHGSTDVANAIHRNGAADALFGWALVE